MNSFKAKLLQDYTPLETNTSRRHDNLILYGNRYSNTFCLDILIEAFDEDSTGWYGTGTIYDLYTPEDIDTALFILVFIDILRVYESKLIYDEVKFFSEKRIFRFITEKDLEVDNIIQAFKDAQESIWYPRKENKFKKEVAARKIELQDLRKGLSCDKQNGKQNALLSNLPENALGEIKTIEASHIDAETPATPKRASTPIDGIEHTLTGVNGIEPGQKDIQQSVTLRDLEKPELEKKPHRSRKACAFCLRSCECLRSTGRTGERGSGPTTEIPNPTGQQLRSNSTIRF